MTNEKETKPTSESSSGSISIGGNVGPGAAIGDEASVNAGYIAGRDISVGAELGEVTDAFAKICQTIESKSFPDEETAQGVKDAIEVIKSENGKGDKANETSVRFSLNMLAQMAPDIFEVAVSTLTNPMLGISTVVKKIAQRAKEEQTKPK
jgi:hypothetical protein